MDPWPDMPLLAAKVARTDLRTVHAAAKHAMSLLPPGHPAHGAFHRILIEAERAEVGLGLREKD